MLFKQAYVNIEMNTNKANTMHYLKNILDILLHWFLIFYFLSHFGQILDKHLSNFPQT